MSGPLPIPVPPVIWIDVGGTFTDCVVQNGDGSLRTFKLLSSGVFRGQVGEGSTRDSIVDPLRSQDPAGFFTGWRLSLRAAVPAARTSVTPTDADDAAVGAASASEEEVRIADFDAATSRLVLARPLRRAPVSGAVYELRCDDPVPVIGIRWLLGTRGGQPVGPVHVHLGTTRGTNALLERRGARTALVTTAGFADVLEIGYQQRPHLFELHVRKPRPLYEQVIEVDERVAADGHALRPLDERHAAEQLRRLHAVGIESLAVCLLNTATRTTSSGWPCWRARPDFVTSAVRAY